MDAPRHEPRDGCVLTLSPKPTVGFEPTTPALRERCSGLLSYVGVCGDECSPLLASLFVRVVVADSAWARLRGLAFRRRPPEGWALLIPRCRSVHTFGMRFPIDLVWLDEEGAVRRGREGRSAAAGRQLPRRTEPSSRPRPATPNSGCLGRIPPLWNYSGHGADAAAEPTQSLARGFQPAGSALSGHLQRVPRLRRLGDRVGGRHSGAALPRHGAHGPVVRLGLRRGLRRLRALRDLLHRPAADEAE